MKQNAIDHVNIQELKEHGYQIFTSYKHPWIYVITPSDNLISIQPATFGGGVDVVLHYVPNGATGSGCSCNPYSKTGLNHEEFLFHLDLKAMIAAEQRGLARARAFHAKLYERGKAALKKQYFFKDFKEAK